MKFLELRVGYWKRSVAVGLLCAGGLTFLTVVGHAEPPGKAEEQLKEQELEQTDEQLEGFPEALEVFDNSEYPEYKDSPPDAPTARLRIVFDPISEETAKHVKAREPFEFFIVAYDVQVALRAWEAALVVDPRILIIDRQLDGLNVGKGAEIATALIPKNCKSGSPLTLARYKAMLPKEGMNDLVLGLAPLKKSSFDPPSPGYLICRPGADLRVFDACDTCAVINPVSVKVPKESTTPLDAVLEPVKGR